MCVWSSASGCFATPHLPSRWRVCALRHAKPRVQWHRSCCVPARSLSPCRTGVGRCATPGPQGHGVPNWVGLALAAVFDCDGYGDRGAHGDAAADPQGPSTPLAKTPQSVLHCFSPVAVCASGVGRGPPSSSASSRGSSGRGGGGGRLATRGLVKAYYLGVGVQVQRHRVRSVLGACAHAQPHTGGAGGACVSVGEEVRHTHHTGSHQVRSEERWKEL